MSTMGGGTTSGYDNLSALLEFVKSPDYLDRIKELRDLEDRSRKAADEAKAAITELDRKSRDLVTAKSAYENEARQLAADRGAHDRRVSRWNRAMAEVQKAIRGED